MLIVKYASLLLGLLALVNPPATAQQLAAVPADTPHVIGPGTQGFRSHVGPAGTDFFWFCDFDSSGGLIPIGEVAEDVHMEQEGDLSSITFSYFTQDGASSGTATAFINVYLNDATDSLLPRCGLLASYVVPGLPRSVSLGLFTHTFDIPSPIPVPKDIWVGIEIDVPGGIGSLAGAGAFGEDPTVQYGNSHNVEWFGGPCHLVPPEGLLIDNIADSDFTGVAFIGNHNLTVRVFPESECAAPVANGNFETATLASWSGTGSRTVVDGFTVRTPPTAGAWQAQTNTAGGASAATLASFLGVSSATLDSLASGTPVGAGSAIRQTISVAAGDTLSFDWNFLTNEPTPNATRNDFSFVTASIGGSALLADTLFATFLPMQTGGGFAEETGYHKYMRTFLSPATVTFGLGVANQGSTANQSSALLIDCVQLTHGAGPNGAPLSSADFSAADLAFLAHGPGAYVVTEGETITVPFTGVDPDGGLLMASAAGLPGSAVLNPTSGSSPLVSTFSWTPTAADKAGAPYLVSVTFADPAGADATSFLEVCDINLRPICSASGQTLECTGPEGAFVTLDGSATDPDDPASSLTYTWFVSDASVQLDDASSPTASGVFPIGNTTATLTVADGRGGVTSCDALITVQDTTPPEVLCTSDVALLWPPKHAMVPVTLIVMATDDCAEPSEILPVLVRVSSSEPDDANGAGDGNTTGDVNGQNGYAAPVDVTAMLSYDGALERWTGTVLLRAERNGTGSGRKYTLDVTAMDSHGNSTTSSCVVVVPHDRRPNS